MNITYLKDINSSSIKICIRLELNNYLKKRTLQIFLKVLEAAFVSDLLWKRIPKVSSIIFKRAITARFQIGSMNRKQCFVIWQS